MWPLDSASQRLSLLPPGAASPVSALPCSLPLPHTPLATAGPHHLRLHPARVPSAHHGAVPLGGGAAAALGRGPPAVGGQPREVVPGWGRGGDGIAGSVWSGIAPTLTLRVTPRCGAGRGARVRVKGRARPACTAARPRVATSAWDAASALAACSPAMRRAAWRMCTAATMLRPAMPHRAGGELRPQPWGGRARRCWQRASPSGASRSLPWHGRRGCETGRAHNALSGRGAAAHPWGCSSAAAHGSFTGTAG